MSFESEVIGSPSIRDDGCVAFRVRVGADEVIVTASPLGLGVSDDVPPDVTGPAMQAVERFTEPRHQEMREHYRQAGKMRREAGRPPLIDRTATAGALVRFPPERRRDAAVFRVQASGVELRVFLFDDGTIVDACDDWEGVTDAGRSAAMAAALNHVLEHPTEAVSWGIDVGLFQDIWD